MKRLWSFLKKYRRYLIIGPSFKVIEAIFELIVPLVVASIVDVGIKNSDSSYVIKMVAVMILLGIVGISCTLVCQYVAAKASQGVGTDMRNAMFKHINQLSHDEIDKIGTPSLVTRINNDVNQIQVGIAMLIRLLIRSPFLVIGAIIMVIGIDIKMSLIFIGAAALIGLVMYIVMSKSVPLFTKIQKSLDKISLITRENLSGARVIRAFSTQEQEKARFYEANAGFTATAVKTGKLSALLNPLITVIINVAIVGVIWFGGIKVDAGNLTQGEIIALVNYLTQILIALYAVAHLVVVFTKSFASLARVNEVFDLQSSIIPDDNGCKEDLSAPIISFENVSFSYNKNDEMALNNINFSIARGETIGIIGGTGSGKTTLVNLIPRFYDVSRGRVLFSGADVKRLSFKSLRGKIGIVPQKSVLFSGTLKQNLLWGANGRDVSDEDIKHALQVSQASDFVERLKDGYETAVVQGGKNLSGGQRQRLAIARAIIREPEVLILDDSASALDFATDARLRKAIRQLDNITVIIVSQRVNTVKNADRIVCMSDGEIAGIGSHVKLYEDCDEYREICSSQLSESELASIKAVEGRAGTV